MSFNRKLILQKAAADREAASVDALASMADGEEPKPAAPKTRASRKARSRKDPTFSPRPMDQLQLYAPLSVLGIPVTVSDPSYRVVNVPSGTKCMALGAPRAAWKGKELLLDVRVQHDNETFDGWIRAAHARALQEEVQEIEQGVEEAAG